MQADEQKHNERDAWEAEMFRLLADNVQDYAIFFVDDGGTIQSWGRGAQRLMGWEPSEMVGESLDRIFTPEDRQQGAPEKERCIALEKGRAEDDRWHLRKDGSRFWCSGVTTPLRSEEGELRGFAKIMRDLSERKQFEEALRQRAHQLAEADRRKDEFLAMLAHELRNPLAPIRSALYLMGTEEADAEVIAQARGIMQRQVEHLVRLVDDLLDVSRIMRGKIELRKEPIELASIVARAVETSQPQIQSQGHNLSIQFSGQPIWLEADPIRLSQVVSNLLNNAAKYTDPEGQIWLSTESHDDRAVLRIRDSGIGISSEMLQHIFDLFSQGDRSIARSQGGLGIGLTVVKNLVEMHGGSVEAHSEGLGKGSEFVVRLHALREAPRPKAEEWKPVPTPARRILVVDDHVGSAKMLATMLQKFWGHEVTLAHKGSEAVSAAQSHRPDIVLLDLGLPDMSGFEVAQQIRRQQELKDVLLVALTGYGRDEDRQRSRQAGFDEHLVKPASVKVLQELFSHPKLNGNRAS